MSIFLKIPDPTEVKFPVIADRDNSLLDKLKQTPDVKMAVELIEKIETATDISYIKELIIAINIFCPWYPMVDVYKVLLEEAINKGDFDLYSFWLSYYPITNDILQKAKDERIVDDLIKRLTSTEKYDMLSHISDVVSVLCRNDFQLLHSICSSSSSPDLIFKYISLDLEQQYVFMTSLAVRNDISTALHLVDKLGWTDFPLSGWYARHDFEDYNWPNNDEYPVYVDIEY
jgi:hypothetical protein